jgi:hypothetical protein
MGEAKIPQSMDVKSELILYAVFKLTNTFNYPVLRATCSYRRKHMLTWIIVILFVLWLVGAFGSNLSPRIPRSGNAIHTLIVIVIILVILNLLGVL